MTYQPPKVQFLQAAGSAVKTFQHLSTFPTGAGGNKSVYSGCKRYKKTEQTEQCEQVVLIVDWLNSVME